MPIAVFIAIGGMLLITAGVVIRLLLIAINSPADVPVSGRIIVTILGSIVLGFLPALSAWAVRRGWKSGPVLVTIVAAVAVFYSLIFGDLLGLVCGVAAVSAVVAIYLPSARRYAFDVRLSQ